MSETMTTHAAKLVHIVVDRFSRPAFSKTILDYGFDLMRLSDSNPSTNPVKNHRPWLMILFYFIFLFCVLFTLLVAWTASYKVPTVALLEFRFRLLKGRELPRSPRLALDCLLSFIRLIAGIPFHGLHVFCALLWSRHLITDVIYQNVFCSMIFLYPVAVSVAYALTTSLHALWTLQIPFRADPKVFEERIYWTRRDLISLAASQGAFIGGLHLLSDVPFIENTFSGRLIWHMFHLLTLVCFEYPLQMTVLAGGPLDKEVVIAKPDGPGNLLLRECAMDPRVGTLATFQDAVDWVLKMPQLLILTVILAQRFIVERLYEIVIDVALDQITEVVVQ